MVLVRKISSDCTSLSYAVEETITKLPAAPVWVRLSPTGYTGDFGASPEYMVDEPIGSGRASKKGIPVKKTVGAGFEGSLRQDWLQPFMPGFFFNKALETGTTDTLNPSDDASHATLTAVTGTGYSGTNFTAQNGWATGAIIYAQGFTNDTNNGMKIPTAVAASSITAPDTVAETPEAKNSPAVKVVGVKVATAPALTDQTALIRIDSTELKMGGNFELEPGQWVYIGGDGDTTNYAGAINRGWVRVKEVSSDGIDCDLSTFPSTPDAGRAGIEFYIPSRTFRDNIMCDDALRTTYQLERRLGKKDTDDMHEQSQLVTGAVANQLDLAIPTGDKIMATLNFVAAESFRRKGDEEPASGADRREIDQTSLMNTSSDLKYAALYRHGGTSTVKDRVFGAITDGTFTINNNCTPIEAWGVYGAYDINTGKLDINCDVTALFTSVEALDLAEEGLDAGLYIICGRENSGMIIDIPLLTVQTSPLNVAVNEPVNISLTNAGNESDFGYAASVQFFDYLPTLATEYKPFVIQ